MKSTLLAVTILLLSSCATLVLGDPWEPMKVPHPMAIVYLYAGDQLATGQEVHIDETPDTPDSKTTVQMISGGYVAHMVPPGAVRFFTGNDDDGSCVTGIMNEGGVYFVRVRESEGIKVVEWITPEDGEAEISNRRKMPREMISNSNARFGPNCTTPPW